MTNYGARGHWNLFMHKMEKKVMLKMTNYLLQSSLLPSYGWLGTVADTAEWYEASKKV